MIYTVNCTSILGKIFKDTGQKPWETQRKGGESCQGFTQLNSFGEVVMGEEA